MTDRGRFPGWLRALVGLWTISTGALADSAPPQQLDAWEGCLLTSDGPVPVVLEHASTREQHRWGLMERDSLPENAGMLFIYDYERSPEQGFWMYQTLLPLDIAFLDNEGVIVSIRQMHPCASSRSNDCPSYPAGVSYWRAVEMNAGYFNSRQIEAGDRLVRDQPAFCNR